MSNQVYANGREVACSAGSGKSICAFPDVCMTPPESPVTPPGVPVPYPNTGMDSDTTDGSRSVQVSSREVMLKNKSYFKKSIGDEAGCAAKKGVVTSVNRGKVYFIAWSMDVKIEGENAVRHLDMTTHNHASPVANTPPQIFAARMAFADIPGCAGQREQIEKKCGAKGEKFRCPDRSAAEKAKKARDAAKKKFGDGSRQHVAAVGKWNRAMEDMSRSVRDDPCQSAMRCLLVPYKANRNEPRCCPGQTAHHLVEAGSFFDKGREATDWVQNKKGDWSIQRSMYGAEKYDADRAPCICVEGENQHQGTHGLLHAHQNASCRKAPKVYTPMHPGTECRTLENAQQAGAQAVVDCLPEAGCDKGCIEAQLKRYHEERCQMAPRLPIRAVEA